MSDRLFFERIRRHGAGQGAVIGAAGLPPAVDGRPDDYRLAPARLLEDALVEHRPLGPAEPCPAPVAFLDGTQHHQVVGYVGTAPVVAAIVRAAVRHRDGGTFRTAGRRERRFLLGKAPALAGYQAPAAGCEVVELESEETVHPLKELELARQAIDGIRSALEHRVGMEFRRSSADWLIVDGVISDRAEWTSDHKTIGVSKSHATLPFDGADLERYLTLPFGHRTSVFEPATWRFAPVMSWAVRLWPFAGKDLLHGLVRVEMAAGLVDAALVDQVSRWILAERAPLARPDPRWDRLLYGVSAVERHLRAR